MKALLVSFAVIAALAGIAMVFALPDFFRADVEPSALESAIVRRLRRAAIPREIRDRQNPIGPSQQVLGEAREHFAEHCAICHANDGRGKTDIGPNLYPPVPDMTADSIQSLSDGELYYAIRNGVRFSGMPAWGSHGDETEGDWENWKLVHFIRHLPRITADELRAMEGRAERSSETEPPPRHRHEH